MPSLVVRVKAKASSSCENLGSVWCMSRLVGRVKAKASNSCENLGRHQVRDKASRKSESES